MNKNLKIVLIIAAVIAVIYFWKKKNAAESEKSDFLGLFTKKGSQKWADKLAKRFCTLKTRLEKLLIQANGGSSVMANAGNVLNNGPLPGVGVSGVGTLMQIKQIEDEMQSIVDSLSAYGYAVSVSTCKAIAAGGTKQFRPGDQIGKDCLCKSGVWAPYCCGKGK